MLADQLPVTPASIQTLPGDDPRRSAALVRDLVEMKQFSRRVSTSARSSLRRKQLSLERIATDVLERDALGRRDGQPATPPFAAVLAARVSDRGPISPLREEDIAAILRHCIVLPSYRPIPLPGALKIVSLVFVTSEVLGAAHLGAEHRVAHAIEHPDLRGYLATSFHARPDVPLGPMSHVAVGIDLAPLLTKYQESGVALALLTAGCVLETLSLVATCLRLRSVILFGVRELRLWTVGDHTHLFFPAALRVGAPLPHSPG
jgi:hypothetical protein